MTARKIFSCKKAITMNPTMPEATHIAVAEGRILAVGNLEDISVWGEMEVDERFADKIILPGFVEGHSHLMEGMMWNHHYIGYYDRRAPDGSVHSGLKTIDEVIAFLQKIDAAREDKTAPLIAWGFDPIFFETRLTADDLDKVSTQCPVLAIHASLHIISSNHFTMQAAGVDRTTNSPNIRTNEDGEPVGEFLGPPGMYMALRVVGLDLFSETSAPDTLWNFAHVAREAGVTTATDLTNPLDSQTLQNLLTITTPDDYPLRLVVAYRGDSVEPQEGVEYFQSIQNQQTDKLRMNLVKLVLDGSLQGFSARLNWPSYFNGAANGLWYIDPDKLFDYVRAYHQAGIQIHIHTNGDQATDHALNVFETVLRETPWRDHRHTLQHCQMASRAQFRRMKALGVGVNLFSNHLYYWGDAHISTTMGPDRAARLDDAGGALAEGVALAIHSDAPVTALAPLFTAWCAVNRLSSKGVRLGGEAETISVYEALYAITLGAAYSLRMDAEIGSLEVGKRADFAILEDDPLTCDPMALKDIGVYGTVVGGEAFLNSGSNSGS